MKKIIFTLCISALALSVLADEKPLKKEPVQFLKQNDGGEKCFDENTHILNIGVGFGGRSYNSLYRVAGQSYGRTPAFSLSYEQAYPKKLGPGYLGIGAYVGFQHEYYRYDYAYWDNNFNYQTYYSHHTWNHVMVAARGAYHWDVLNAKNAEVYGGVIVGMRFQIHSYETNDPGKKDPYTYKQSIAYPAGSAFVGARWYFAKNFGLFAELGYGISYATGGFSIKF